MYISRSPNNVNFGKVYAVAGNDYQMNKLRSYFERTPSDMLYLESKKSKSLNSFFAPKKPQTMKRLALIVVGKKDVGNINTKTKGWRTLREISKHVEKFIDLTSVKK